MSTRKPRKPWVFPLVAPQGADILQLGLNRRDLNASLAMHALISAGAFTAYDGDEIAKGAYDVADAMEARALDEGRPAPAESAADPVNPHAGLTLGQLREALERHPDRCPHGFRPWTECPTCGQLLDAMKPGPGRE